MKKPRILITKAVSFIALVVMFFAMLPMQHSEAAGSYKIQKATVTDDFIKHSQAHCSKTVGSGTHGCCWYYASAAYKKIWGKSFAKDPKTNLLRDIPASKRKMTAANLELFFSQAKPGAVFRMSGDTLTMGTKDTVGHSMIFVKKGNNGAYFWEGNYDGKGRTRIYFWSWSKLLSQYGKKYPYVKYIAWPGAPKLASKLEAPSISLENTTSGVTCTWKKVENATGYTIYRDGKKIGSVSGGNNLTYTDKKVKNGRSYSYTVSAYNQSATSKKSATRKIVYLSVPTISSISNPASSIITENHLKVVWKKNSSAYGYEIQISTSKSFANARTITITSSKTTSTTVRNMELKTYY